MYVNKYTLSLQVIKNVLLFIYIECKTTNIILADLIQYLYQDGMVYMLYGLRLYKEVDFYRVQWFYRNLRMGDIC